MAHKRLFIFIVGLPIVLIILMAFLMIFNNIRTFKEYYDEQIRYRENEYMSMYQKEIYDNVWTVLKIIEYEHDQIELELKQFLKSQLITAVDVANAIYNEYKDRASDTEIKQRIVRQLNRMQFNDGRGYFYVHEYSTNTVIGHPIKQFVGIDFSDKVDQHGDNIIALQKNSLKDGEIGFTKLYFNKPDDTTKEYLKLVCVTRFKPLDLLIGTGEYLDIVQERIQERVLEQIAILNERYGDKYVFIYKLYDINGGEQFASRLLTQAKGIQTGEYLSSGYKDAKGFKYRETMLADIRTKGDSYLTYWFPDRKTKEAKPKHSYFYWQKDWDWIIGCGFYYDQYNSDIQNIERIFKNISDKYIKLNIMIIFGILLAVIIISFLMLTKLTNTLKKYMDQISLLNKQLERSSRAKSQFLANMSHEIRTPLHGIIGLNEILLDSPVTPVQREYLNKARQASYALMNVINDILDYSKMEAGKLSIVKSDFNLNDMLANLSDLFGFMIYEKGLEFCFRVAPDVPVMLTGDAQRITQVLNNFVGNSVKFTHEGNIAVEVSLMERKASSVVVRFRVCDTGIGISEQNQEKIFQPFEQEDSSTTKTYGGTGLGLIISRQLIEMMGGELIFESKKGEGSCFGFIIELEYNQEKQETPIYNRQFSDAKFLVAEDMDEQREYLVNILRSWGISPVQVKNGKEAFDILMKERFDYMILDWKMPVMDGLSLLNELNYHKIAIPSVLMITAYDKEDMDVVCDQLGVRLDKVLYKPFTPSNLFETLFDEKALSSSVELSKTIRLESTKKLLLVEDNPTNTLVAVNLLERVGFEVITAVNGAEAVRMAKNESFDIIFMDIQMPVMDGYEATQKIREFDKKTPVIALSAAAMQNDVQQAKQTGMDYHMAKPIDLKELEAIIEQYFKVHRINRSEPEYVNLVSVDHVDVEKLYSAIGDADKVYQMLSSFRENHRHDLEMLENMGAATQEFRSYTHKLKGSSGNLKMAEIYDLCRTIEGELDHDRLKAYKLRLKNLLENVFKGIEQKITPLTATSESDITKKDYLEMTASVVEAIDESQLIKSSVIFAIVNYLSANGQNVRGEQIRQAFQDKNLKKLRELLNS